MILAVFAHAAFVRASWFWRYEAYLEAMAIVAVVSSGWAVAERVRDTRLSWRHGAVVAAVIAAALFARDFRQRARTSFAETPTAMRNIFDQQLQSARFVREHLTVPGPVVINDLGLVAYAGTRPVVDFVGLGDTKMALTWLSGEISASAIEQRAREADARVAVVYVPWLEFAGGVPKSWIRIGDWTIDDNVVAGDSTVTVFATTPDVVPHLRHDFAAFARTLPPRTLANLADEPISRKELHDAGQRVGFAGGLVLPPAQHPWKANRDARFVARRSCDGLESELEDVDWLDMPHRTEALARVAADPAIELARSPRSRGLSRPWQSAPARRRPTRRRCSR